MVLLNILKSCFACLPANVGEGVGILGSEERDTRWIQVFVCPQFMYVPASVVLVELQGCFIILPYVDVGTFCFLLGGGRGGGGEEGEAWPPRATFDVIVKISLNTIFV